MRGSRNGGTPIYGWLISWKIPLTKRIMILGYPIDGIWSILSDQLASLGIRRTPSPIIGGGLALPRLEWLTCWQMQSQNKSAEVSCLLVHISQFVSENCWFNMNFTTFTSGSPTSPRLGCLPRVAAPRHFDQEMCFAGAASAWLKKSPWGSPSSSNLRKESAWAWMIHGKLGVSINGGTHKWMVSKGKSQSKVDDSGVPLFQETFNLFYAPYKGYDSTFGMNPRCWLASLFRWPFSAEQNWIIDYLSDCSDVFKNMIGVESFISTRPGQNLPNRVRAKTKEHLNDPMLFYFGFNHQKQP